MNLSRRATPSMDGWMDGVDGWNGWMDGWMDGMYVCIALGWEIIMERQTMRDGSR